MKRNKNNFLTRIAGFAISIAICLGTAAPVFAAEGPITGEPAEAAITKVFKMPTGTVTPEQDFTFSFTKLGTGEYDKMNTDGAAKAAMPALGDIIIKFDPNDTDDKPYADSGIDSENPANDTGVRTIIKEADIFSGTEDLTWPHAGVYNYQVKETTKGKYTSKVELICSEAVYDIAVYVKENESGTLYVHAISVRIKANDESNAGANQGDKTDKLTFTNSYLQKNPTIVPPTDPENSVLTISKMVSGDYANKDQYFEFKITVTRPAIIVDGTPMYKAYLVENGAIVSPIVPSSLVGTGVMILNDEIDRNCILFTSGTTGTVSLKSGQSLSFFDLDVGSTFKVTETGAEGYTAGYTVTHNNNGPESEKTSGAEGASFGFPNSNDLTNKYVGQSRNSAEFTNTYKLVTPTGVSVDDLPFIALFGIVIGAAAAYAAVKSRVRTVKPA